MAKVDNDFFLEKLGKLESTRAFDGLGFVPLTGPQTMQHYQRWIDQDLHGDMSWMKEHTSLKASPNKLLPGARSAIVVYKTYSNHPWPEEDFPFKATKIAKYAKGSDYHFYLKRDLKLLIQDLERSFPNETFHAYVDSAPVLERDLAHRARLGWFGKNSCLISRDHGSLFLIGEIYTSIETNPPRPPVQDFCGTCTKCLDSCPTGALISPKVLDARKCISYWTIEAPSVPPVELRENFQGWLFGCDICQDVCPWNTRLADLTDKPVPSEDLTEELRWILESSGKQIQKRLASTPLSRASGKKLKRNALIVIANENLVELSTLVQSYFGHSELGELAKWAYQKIQNTRHPGELPD